MYDFYGDIIRRNVILIKIIITTDLLTMNVSENILPFTLCQ